MTNTTTNIPNVPTSAQKSVVKLLGGVRDMRNAKAEFTVSMIDACRDMLGKDAGAAAGRVIANPDRENVTVLVDHSNDAITYGQLRALAIGMDKEHATTLIDRVIGSAPAGRAILDRITSLADDAKRLGKASKSRRLSPVEAADLMEAKRELQLARGERNTAVKSLERANRTACYIVEQAALTGDDYAFRTVDATNGRLHYAGPTGEVSDTDEPVIDTLPLNAIDLADAFVTSYAKWITPERDDDTSDDDKSDDDDASNTDDDSDKSDGDSTSDDASNTDDNEDTVATDARAPNNKESDFAKGVVSAMRKKANRMVMIAKLHSHVANGVPETGDERDALLALAIAVLDDVGTEAVAAFRKKEADDDAA